MLFFRLAFVVVDDDVLVIIYIYFFRLTFTFHNMSTLRGGDRKIDWAELSGKLPSSKTAADKQKRRQIFNGMDMNGNGYLSLAEVDKGVRDVLKSDDLFDCKPAMLRAFNAVKDTAPAHTPHSDDYVTRSEFRLLMVCFVLFYLSC